MRRRAREREQQALQAGALTWQAASLLLDYPGEEVLARAAAVRDALPTGHPLQRFAAELLAADPTELEAEYVETFDTRRRCPLYLTYFAHGDTRKRGIALLRFKQTYRESGLELTETELPDHLCVVLEFAGTVDPEAGRQLLLDHRAGLEVLRLSLRDLGSRYHQVLEAVCAELPGLGRDEQQEIRRLAEQGPPAEEVGLTPYGTPGFDPALTGADPSGPAAGRVDLPMPTVRGA